MTCNSLNDPLEAETPVTWYINMCTWCINMRTNVYRLQQSFRLLADKFRCLLPHPISTLPSPHLHPCVLLREVGSCEEGAEGGENPPWLLLSVVSSHESTCGSSEALWDWCSWKTMCTGSTALRPRMPKATFDWKLNGSRAHGDIIYQCIPSAEHIADV